MCVTLRTNKNRVSTLPAACCRRLPRWDLTGCWTASEASSHSLRHSALALLTLLSVFFVGGDVPSGDDDVLDGCDLRSCGREACRGRFHLVLRASSERQRRPAKALFCEVKPLPQVSTHLMDFLPDVFVSSVGFSMAFGDEGRVPFRRVALVGLCPFGDCRLTCGFSKRLFAAERTPQLITDVKVCDNDGFDKETRVPYQ